MALFQKPNAQFEHWVDNPIEESRLAVFHSFMLSAGYQAGQVKFMLDNPDIAVQNRLSVDALNQAKDAFGEGWNEIESRPVSAPSFGDPV